MKLIRVDAAEKSLQHVLSKVGGENTPEAIAIPKPITFLLGAQQLVDQLPNDPPGDNYSPDEVPNSTLRRLTQFPFSASMWYLLGRLYAAPHIDVFRYVLIAVT